MPPKLLNLFGKRRVSLVSAETGEVIEGDVALEEKRRLSDAVLECLSESQTFKGVFSCRAYRSRRTTYKTVRKDCAKRNRNR